MSEESLGKCVICGKEAGVIYPLLLREPAFCSEHHNPKDAGPFGCDFTGPDDFDIPFPGEFDSIFTGNRKTFVWTDKEGNKHKLKDIDDRYLQNIIGFLRRKSANMEDMDSATYWTEVIVFLEKEQKIRLRKVETGNRKELG